MKEELILPNKKILIVYPHFPPSNLAGVHRPRLFAKHLPTFGWEPTILTVHERYYEEKLDANLADLLPKKLRVEKVAALSVTKPRLVGDLGLRAIFQLYWRAKRLIQKEKFDFLLIPVPSFYTALLGRWLHHNTGISYGIDYIDPWVHHFPGSEKKFSRHWWSTKLAVILEPIAVKKASLITGVAEGYYKGVLHRTPTLRATVLTAAMPYGGEKSDMEVLVGAGRKPYLFGKEKKLQMVYAGAMLPKAFEPLAAILEAIAENRQAFEDVEFHFIGTGKTSDDPEGYNIKPLAEQFGLWKSIVFEHPKRIPYLDVLVHLKAADGIFILGSTEPHYTPSKIYQAVMAEKPLFAVLHQESTAVGIIRSARAGTVLDFNGAAGLGKIRQGFMNAFLAYRKSLALFDPAGIDQAVVEQYSARASTAKLAGLLDQVVKEKNPVHAKN